MLWGLAKFLGWLGLCVIATVVAVFYWPTFCKIADIIARKVGDPHADEDAKAVIICIGILILFFSLLFTFFGPF